MELYNAMRTTFACRDFTGDDLDDAVLYRILDNARFAPSGGNRQAVRIVAVRAAEARYQLAELSRPGATRYVGQLINGESPWNPVDPDWTLRAALAPTVTEDMLIPFLAPLQTASVVLVMCVDLRNIAATDQDLDRIGLVGGSSVYPLAWNILLGARAEGFGGTFTTMVAPEEAKVRQLLHIPDGHAVAALIPLGRPTRQLSRLRRKPVEETVTREHFDGPALAPTAIGDRTRPSGLSPLQLPQQERLNHVD